jgi:hypothetical protein
MAHIKISNLNLADSFLTEVQTTDATQVMGGSGNKNGHGDKGGCGGYGGDKGDGGHGRNNDDCGGNKYGHGGKSNGGRC